VRGLGEREGSNLHYHHARKRPLSRLHPPLSHQIFTKTSTNVFLSALLAHDCMGLKWSLSRRSHTAWRFVYISDKHFSDIYTLFLVSMRQMFATQFYILRNKMCSMQKGVCSLCVVVSSSFPFRWPISWMFGSVHLFNFIRA